jgi:hypothetical protein
MGEIIFNEFPQETLIFFLDLLSKDQLKAFKVLVKFKHERENLFINAQLNNKFFKHLLNKKVDFQ